MKHINFFSLFSYFFCLVLIGMAAILYFALELKTSPLRKKLTQSGFSVAGSSAKLADIMGIVKVQHGGHLGWRDYEVGESLFENDLIFVDSQSRAEVEFHSGDRVSIVGESFFRVTKHPEFFSGFKRKFAAQKSVEDVEAQQPDYKPSFMTFLAPHLNKSRFLKVEIAADENQKLTVVRTIRYREMLYPPSDQIIAASRFPIKIRVIFAPSQYPREPKISYLWSLTESGRPVWSEVTRGDSTLIVLRGPGQYIFQSMSESESEATRPLALVALEPGPTNMETLFASDTAFERVFQ